MKATFHFFVPCCMSCLRTLDLYKEAMEFHKGGHYFPRKTKRWDVNPTTVQFGGLYTDAEHSSWKVDYFFSHFKFGSLCEEECSRKDHQIKWSPGSRRESTQPREMATVFV